MKKGVTPWRVRVLVGNKEFEIGNKPREKMANSEPLSGKMNDEIASQVEMQGIISERMDFTRKTRIEKKRLVKKCEVARE